MQRRTPIMIYGEYEMYGLETVSKCIGKDREKCKLVLVTYLEIDVIKLTCGIGVRK